MTGNLAVVKSIVDPRAIAPRAHRLSRLSDTFRYKFPPDSVTVLDLRS